MKNIRQVFTPNHDERRGGVRPTLLILHYTGTAGAQEAEEYYTNARTDPKAGPIAPHYMIDRDGAVTQFVAEDKRAWHAGHSWWDGHGDINSHSIGIELVNPGHDNGYPAFPPQQMESLAELVRGIVTRHAIAPHCILGHSDVSPIVTPERWKRDPGELMDWFWLAARGIGLWPQPAQEDYDMAAVLFTDQAALRQGLTDYGYDPAAAFDEIVSAFQRHFQPEAHLEKRGGQIDRETAAKLHWLLKAKNSYAP